MGLILDSSLLIGAERQAQPVGSLLRMVREKSGLAAPMISAVTVMELAHGIWRAGTPELEQRRRTYVQEVFAAIPVQAFTKEMAERAAQLTLRAERKGR